MQEYDQDLPQDPNPSLISHPHALKTLRHLLTLTTSCE